MAISSLPLISVASGQVPHVPRGDHGHTRRLMPRQQSPGSPVPPRRIHTPTPRNSPWLFAIWPVVRRTSWAGLRGSAATARSWESADSSPASVDVAALRDAVGPVSAMLDHQATRETNGEVPRKGSGGHVEQRGHHGGRPYRRGGRRFRSWPALSRWVPVKQLFAACGGSAGPTWRRPRPAPDRPIAKLGGVGWPESVPLTGMRATRRGVQGSAAVLAWRITAETEGLSNHLKPRCRAVSRINIKIGGGRFPLEALCIGMGVFFCRPCVSRRSASKLVALGSREVAARWSTCLSTARSASRVSARSRTRRFARPLESRT